MSNSNVQNVFAALRNQIGSYKAIETMYYVLRSNSYNECVIEDNHYCNACIDVALDKCSKQWLQNIKPELTKNITFRKTSMLACEYECDVFCFCGQCGQAFNVALLLTEQEIKHWESLSDQDYLNLSPEQAWQIYTVLLEQDSRYPARVTALVERLAALFTAFSGGLTND